MSIDPPTPWFQPSLQGRKRKLGRKKDVPCCFKTGVKCYSLSEAMEDARLMTRPTLILQTLVECFPIISTNVARPGWAKRGENLWQIRLAQLDALHTEGVANSMGLSVERWYWVRINKDDKTLQPVYVQDQYTASHHGRILPLIHFEGLDFLEAEIPLHSKEHIAALSLDEVAALVRHHGRVHSKNLGLAERAKSKQYLRAASKCRSAAQRSLKRKQFWINASHRLYPITTKTTNAG